jgi:hypothetical protein
MEFIDKREEINLNKWGEMAKNSHDFIKWLQVHVFKANACIV